MMGPFRVVKNSSKQGVENFVITDRWNDFAATVNTQEHADAWIRLYYKTLKLEEDFLGVNSKALERWYARKNKKRQTGLKAKPTAKKRHIPRVALKLSCGAEIFVERMAA